MAPAHGFRRRIVARRGARALLRDRSSSRRRCTFGCPGGGERGRGRSGRGTATEAPDPTGSPPRPRARAPGSEAPGEDGNGTSERGRREPASIVGPVGTARAVLGRPECRFPSRHGAKPVRPGGSARREPHRLPHSSRAARDARRVREGSGNHEGTETGRELRTGRGATPGPRMDTSTWTVEEEATGQAERELRTSKKRAPALTSRAADLDDEDGGAIPERRSAPARATALSRRETRWRRADPDHAPSGGRAVRARE